LAGRYWPWFIICRIKWWEKNKQKLAKPEKRKIRIWPHDRVGEITIIALIFGLVGAKIFNAFETWDSFIQDPMGSLFSAEGLTFMVGLFAQHLLFGGMPENIKLVFGISTMRLHLH
jgi:hypothetical protein